MVLPGGGGSIIKFFVSFILFLSILQTTVFAQYIRRKSFPTEHERRMQYALDDWVSYLESHVVSSMVVGTNYLYVGTMDGGILRYQLFQNFWDYPFTTSNGLAGNRVLDVRFDESNGYLWAVTQPLSDPFNAPDTCFFRPAENEWHCKSGEYFWNQRFPGKPSPGSGGSLKKNVFYSSGYLDALPVFFANGGYTLQGNTTLLDEHFDEFPISGFLIDHWERVWAAIDGLGIGIGNTFSQRMDIYPMGLSHISPRTIRYNGNDLWIGGVAAEGRGRPGIVRWRDSDGGWEYFQARFNPYLPSDNLWDMEFTGDSLWFATDYGVSMLDVRKNKWKNFNVGNGLYSEEINDLQAFGKMLLVGTQNGLNTIDLSTGIVKREKNKNIHLATIYQVATQDSVIWAATNRGILKKVVGGNTWQQVQTTASIQDVPVTAVEVFRNEVWFASPGGIFWYDVSTNKWESFPQIGMELNGPYRDLAVNRESVWVSSRAGLLKYDRKRLYWILFTTRDGLLDDDCRQLFLDGDYLWIATYSGICQFFWNNPDRID